MDANATIEEIQNSGKLMTALLGLLHSPVGVRFLALGMNPPSCVENLHQHRYCQALMWARQGRSVLLDGQGIACPAAAAAFGFHRLPAGLRSGKGLVGFGIVSEEVTGRRMFETMPVLKPGQVSAVHLFPLDQALVRPDVIVIEDDIEKLMWINLAYLNAEGGNRIIGSTAVLQAACVDATIIPYLEDRLNFSYGCYGCRDATDIGANETLLGFPGAKLAAVVKHLDFLSRKAIPAARTKHALQMLKGKWGKLADSHGL